MGWAGSCPANGAIPGSGTVVSGGPTRSAAAVIVGMTAPTGRAHANVQEAIEPWEQQESQSVPFGSVGLPQVDVATEPAVVTAGVGAYASRGPCNTAVRSNSAATICRCIGSVYGSGRRRKRERAREV